MTEIRKGRPEDMAAIISFAINTFSTPEEKVDFPTLLPKLYGPAAQTAPGHILLFEAGQLAGLLYREIIQWQHSPGQVYTLAGIGTVCTAPAFRGKGVMEKLMQALDEDLQANNVDIALLDGQRQRYQYYGYDKAGAQANYHINSANIRHAFASEAPISITFQPLEADANHVKQAYQLFCKQPCRVLRPEQDFPLILQSWNSTAHAILQNGQFAGYIALAQPGNNYLNEIEVIDTATLAQVLPALFKAFSLSELAIPLPLYAADKVAAFEAICEDRTITWNHAFRFYNASTAAFKDSLYIPALDGV